jgi:hypothetical protein
MIAESALDPSPVKRWVLYHPRGEHACFSDFLKRKQAKMIYDVRTFAFIQTFGCCDEPLSLFKAE